MPYGKGAFTDAHGLKLCIGDTVIEHIKSNTGYGSGGASSYAAIFLKKGFAVWERYLRAVNGYDLSSLYPRETRMGIQGIPAAEEIENTFKAFLENGMAGAGTCFAESLL